MRRTLWTILCVLFTFAGIALYGDEKAVTFSSGNRHVALIELFTSQGCSSCPPAEKWLNSFKDHPDLWKTLVPVAFHVSYWDRLGWKDIYASKKYTRRQYSYKKSGILPYVYTPCLVINGVEWKGWYTGLGLPYPSYNSGTLSGRLQHRKLSIKYTRPEKDQEVHVAILGFDIITVVKRGENRNRSLKQEFVVLAHKKYHSSIGKWSITVPGTGSLVAGRYGIAIWISGKNKLIPVQAAGGWVQQKHILN